MAEFDPKQEAHRIVDYADQLMTLQLHLNKDPQRYSADDIASEHAVAEKIRAELDPIWSQPEKLRDFGSAIQSLGAEVKVDPTNGLPTEFWIPSRSHPGGPSVILEDQKSQPAQTSIMPEDQKSHSPTCFENTTTYNRMYFGGSSILLPYPGSRQVPCPDNPRADNTRANQDPVDRTRVFVAGINWGDR
jgi:hypothetical protein